MKTFGKFTKIAVAAAVTGALVLPASAAFAGDKSNKTERAVIGALIGGIAGAALSKGDTGGIAIGAVAGAALGASTGGNDRDHRYSSGYRDTRYGNGYGYNTGYNVWRRLQPVVQQRLRPDQRGVATTPATAATNAATATTPATVRTAASMGTATTASAAKRPSSRNDRRRPFGGGAFFVREPRFDRERTLCVARNLL
jgi:hypothetical protein